MIRLSPSDQSRHPPAGTVLVVSQLLLPMRWWRGVRLRRMIPVTMTALERFTLELALSVGRADPDEFSEITGLPEALLPVAARRLVTAGALEPDGGGYLVVRELSERIAASATIQIERSEPYDIVMLPRTDDILALKPRTSWVPALERSRPKRSPQAPVPTHLCGRSLDDVLDERLGAGPIPGTGHDVTGVTQPSGDLSAVDDDGLCPAYECSAVLRVVDGEYLPTVQIRSSKAQLTIPLPGAYGLVRRWLELLGTLETDHRWAEVWDELTGDTDQPVPPVERSGGYFRWWLNGAATNRLRASGRNLAVPIGVEARDDDLVADLLLVPAPSDDRAAELFAVDRELTAAAEPGVVPAPQLYSPALRERAWQLGFYPLVYTLREESDFSYD
jgi:hypothetical protein